jgi:hypothetical protein
MPRLRRGLEPERRLGADQQITCRVEIPEARALKIFDNARVLVETSLAVFPNSG